METTTRLILPEVREALGAHPDEIVELTEELHPADLADLASALEPELALQLLTVVPIPVAARLLEACEEEEVRLELFEPVAEKALARAVAITAEMAPDDRADLYAELPEALRRRLLEAMDDDERRDIRRLLAYPEGSAGALLTTEFVALAASATISEAIEVVRANAAEMETIYQAYAVDPHGTLLGVVSLRDLVTSPATCAIDEIMTPNIVVVNVHADQEEVARLIAKYDLLALPVVDDQHRIAGIITVEDVIDVVEEEATEDAHKLGAVEPLEASYMATPIRELIKARAPWLMALFTASLATSNVMQHYTSETFQAFAILTWFVPLIISSGGNSGSQSATLVIRAMAVDNLESRDALRILGRELLVGVSLGTLVSLIGAARLSASSATRSADMIIAFGVAVTLVVTVGALVGSGVPLLLRRLRIDPAVSSTPFVASVLDLAGLVIYFETARLFLT
jgi:magnesium transporter